MDLDEWEVILLDGTTVTLWAHAYATEGGLTTFEVLIRGKPHYRVPVASFRVRRSSRSGARSCAVDVVALGRSQCWPQRTAKLRGDISRGTPRSPLAYRGSTDLCVERDHRGAANGLASVLEPAIYSTEVLDDARPAERAQ